MTDRSLLAVDVGLRAGLALYGGDGKLRWYRSRNFGSAASLKRGIPTILDSIEGLGWLVTEGGGPLADAWAREASRRGVTALSVPAEDWRELLLHPRERKNGADAKRNAGELARRVIEWSEAARPTSLRHDAAEAILAGLWGAVEVGLLERVPVGLRR